RGSKRSFTEVLDSEFERCRMRLPLITSRSAPMLGLVATMIPMGPALLALTRNDAQGIGENLVVAFSAVILALVAASITFFILTVRRRWLLQELRAVERAREAG
ncbi:MotA/TolQ/ExbB proton channel family protein, partial [Pseudomonas aeruginosa]|uniref:MotA/TolQ/ExbB proton channel family protein n=1 Tax=Pseudomonas aeruginosa TaxID=287 RepID=UPI0024499F62